MIAAVEDNASDIHIEPRANNLSVRFRIDGILHEYTTYPINMHRGIVSRIKILSFLDISERYKPPDGRILVKGIGKTTTLYAALNEINSIGKNIVTIEDPIEYQLPIINQMQVNPKKP